MLDTGYFLILSGTQIEIGYFVFFLEKRFVTRQLGTDSQRRFCLDDCTAYGPQIRETCEYQMTATY